MNIAEHDNTLSKNELVSIQSQNHPEGVQAVEAMLSSLKQPQKDEMKMKECSMLYMTDNYYKTETNVKDTGIHLGDVNDAECAQAVLYALRCTSSYKGFMVQVNTLNEKYGSSTVHGGSDDTIKKYYDVRTELVRRSSNMYGPLRDTFMFGSKINLCKESLETKTDLLVSKLIFIL